MNALHIRHLYHRFGPSEVLADVGLDLYAGESLALVGPSGCGKSTLLQIVAGLLRPSRMIMHCDFRGLGCVFQQPSLMPWMTTLDNLALGLKALGVPRAARHRQAAGMAARLGLAASDLDKYPHELSGGMQSRVSLGRALVLAPDLLLLDEPFSALDVGLRLELYALLREQVEQRRSAVLLITHDLMEAVRLADRILVLAGSPGRIVGRYEFDLPPAVRNDLYVNQHTAALLSDPVIIENFSLKLRIG